VLLGVDVHLPYAGLDGNPANYTGQGSCGVIRII